MALDAISADPLTFRCGYNSTVRVTVKRLGKVFSAANFPASGLALERYSVWMRAIEDGAEEYFFNEELDKDPDEEGVCEKLLPAWALTDAGRTFRFWVVLVDSDTAPSGAPTESGAAEEILGEFIRTIEPGLIETAP